MKYWHFKKIEGERRIAGFFNHVMGELDGIRSLCAPDSFKKDESTGGFSDDKFCDFCRYEAWMHAVVERLEDWVSTTDKYFAEFSGSWKYYAAAQRLDIINRYGGEEEDYDKNGDIRRDGLSDSDYRPYSVINDLWSEGAKDIVQDTMPADMRDFCSDIIANSRIDVLEGLKMSFGHCVKVYKETDDGDMRLVSDEEHDLDMVSRQVAADDDTKIILAVAGGIQGIIRILRRCKYNDDNTELLQMVHDASSSLLYMDFGTLSTVIKKFSERYNDEEGTI